MAIDSKLSLMSAQAITNTNVLSTILDLGDYVNIGEGGVTKYIYIDVDTAFTEDSSGEYLRIDLVASSGADPATSDQVMVILKSTAVSSGSPLLTAGHLRKFALPGLALSGMDHVGIAVIVTSAVAAGKITAYIDI
jgi:hypothetical protein